MPEISSPRRGSRKLKAAWIITALTTTMLIVSTLSTAIGGALDWGFEWKLVGEGTWMGIVTLIWSAYFASNVVEKHTSFVQDAEYNEKLETPTWEE